MARKLEELPVYAKVTAFSDAVSAIIARPAFGRNRRLHDQIDEANASILANMAEGFEQSTDSHVARFLYTAKGSVAEVVARLRRAQRSGLIGADECSLFSDGRRNRPDARRLDQVSGAVRLEGLRPI